jgi:hypothetical protein
MREKPCQKKNQLRLLLMALHESYLPQSLVLVSQDFCQPHTLTVSISIPSCNLDCE